MKNVLLYFIWVFMFTFMSNESNADNTDFQKAYFAGGCSGVWKSHLIR